MMSNGAWLPIAAYLDFHDVPRLILVADRPAGFWILDSRFDHALDEYLDHYDVYFAADEAEPARAAFERHADGAIGARVATVPVAHCRFDPSRRRELMLNAL